MKILAIHDDNAGHVSQLIGVVEKFNCHKITLGVQKTILGFLPNILAQWVISLNATVKKSLDNIVLNLVQGNYKDNTQDDDNKGNKTILIIAIGKKTLPYSLYIKQQLLKYIKQQQLTDKLKVKLVYLMPAGKRGIKNSDLTFYHSYKNKVKPSENLIAITAAPNKITQDTLEKNTSIEYKNLFMALHKPLISVFIGGDAKNIHLSEKAIEELINNLVQIQQKTQGVLLISTSRRTKIHQEQAIKTGLLQQGLINKDNEKIVANKGIFWGYHDHNQDKKAINPYFAMLFCADMVIVTGESVSMISEAIALPSKVGVYIYYSPNFYSKRYLPFHQLLYANNHAYSIEDLYNDNNHTVNTRVSLNSTDFVVDKISSLF